VGYHGSVSLACGTDSGAFSLSGCEENVCTGFPSTDGITLPQLGDEYIVFDDSCGGASNLTVTNCESPAYIGCDSETHSGTVTLTCARSGQTFEVTGCEPNVCVLPATTVELPVDGYEIVNDACAKPSGSGTAAACASTVQCAAGYFGEVELQCRQTDTFFTLLGCVEVTCEWPEDAVGYDILDETCGGRSLTEAQCNFTGFVTCATGFTGAVILSCDSDSSTFGLSGCVDIDECSDGSHTCAAGATCSNLAGSYDCTCPDGYVGNGWTCVDDDECAVDTANLCHAEALCTNLDGNYSCSCNVGFDGDGYTCVDDEPPTLELVSYASSTVFVAFGARFNQEDLVLHCTDSAGIAEVSFTGDIVDTNEPGTYTIIINCTDAAGLYSSAEAVVRVGHEQLYSDFIQIEDGIISNGALDVNLAAQGLTLTCDTTVEMSTAWHPLILVLEFTLCDLQVRGREW